MKKHIKFTVFAISIIVALIFAISVFLFVNRDINSIFFEAIEQQLEREVQNWTTVKIPIPEHEKTDVFFAIRINHPFLAEFDRKVILRTPSSKENDVSIFSDTGGMTTLKVFWYSDKEQA